MGMSSIKEYPDVSFIDEMQMEDIQQFYINAMQDKYKELTGRELVLNEADPIRLIAYSNCLLLYQILQYADRAGKMGLLKYSYGDYLENIGALKGIRRIQGAAAKTILRFTLSVKKSSTVIIPAKTRVTATDGVYFCTKEILEIPAGNLDGEVSAECQVIGIKGNGYEPGTLKVLVDPMPYVDKVENVTISEGGTDIETDENLAERIFLAPSSWSTAGPDDAYHYWVKTFNPAIEDVRVESEIPGEVDIYFLMKNGQIPEEAILRELAEYLANEEIRPLTDHVVVRAPDIQEYEIDLTYYINESDRTKAAAIQERVNTAVQEYIKWQGEKIGRDLNPDRLRNLMIIAGVKRIEIREPTFKRISQRSVAVHKGEAVVLYGGLEDD